MKKDELFYKAAKLVATCPKDRLELVLEVLQKGEVTTDGFDEIIEKIKKDKRQSVYERRKGDEKRDLWKTSDNPVTILLRKAYNRNISMTSISRLSGVHRVTLYKYMRGLTTPGERVSSAITNAVNEIFSDLDGAKEE